ncbi:MAG: hypothetical protein RJB39_558 [Candidatus Parcubacteria bacterium]|jgi:DNA-binding response OmpR family regulator
MKILLIEDDASLVAALKMSLIKEGYTVDALMFFHSRKKDSYTDSGSDWQD